MYGTKFFKGWWNRGVWTRFITVIAQSFNRQAIFWIFSWLSVYLSLFNCVCYKKFLLVKKVGLFGLSYFFILWKALSHFVIICLLLLFLFYYFFNFTIILYLLFLLIFVTGSFSAEAVILRVTYFWNSHIIIFKLSAIEYLKSPF